MCLLAFLFVCFWLVGGGRGVVVFGCYLVIHEFVSCIPFFSFPSFTFCLFCLNVCLSSFIC